MNQAPISTQWLVNSTAPPASNVIMSVPLVAVQNTGRKGTGWLASDQHVITNEHVVRGAQANSIAVLFPDGSQQIGTLLGVDAQTDLAAITLPGAISFPPLSIDDSELEVGSRVCAWGYPLGYNGPAPILSVGYLAGFNAHQPQGLPSPLKRLVLNAALNPGNSGGPILAWGEQSVRGVAVTKHAPITHLLQSAINALANNRSGVTFTATAANGSQRTFVESQIVAEVLTYFRDMTQVVIGEAIAPDDLIAFLDRESIPWARS